MNVTVRRLCGSFAAEVRGLDLSVELDAGPRSQLIDLLGEHLVLVVRGGASAGRDEQERLADAFGERRPLPTLRFLGELEATRSVTADQLQVTARSAGRAELAEQLGFAAEFDRWHTDSSFTAELPRAAVLRAEVLPPVGGDTYFVDMCAAYERLSPTVRGWIDGLSAYHASPPYYKAAIDIDRYGDDAAARFDAEFPPRLHPMVVEHPTSRRRALFVNPVYTVGVEGLSPLESSGLLRMLFTHAISAEHIYRHHWEPGDLLVWDELVNLHLAPTDFAPHARRVVRVLAGTVVPTAPTR
ncbi:MAG TPA: TauD/TfdA family dioxygenase [Ilumatobacter sp.]|nr:TauD/TfdA family dioxygenase [Ilumatobacter sp.]